MIQYVYSLRNTKPTILRGRKCGMTKTELANSVAEAVDGLTKKKAAEAVEALLISIKNLS
ncbi:hypothetical protein FACS1894216_22140 [Synergistales bacterium]|nr:hypothetical protein FACS1894216_22140 [Synergistales bacterium]